MHDVDTLADRETSRHKRLEEERTSELKRNILEVCLSVFTEEAVRNAVHVPNGLRYGVYGHRGPELLHEGAD